VGRSALILSGVGLALVIVSTFLPYVRIVVVIDGLRLVATRSAWQMGANKSIEIGAGPSIVLWALVAAAQEFIHYRPKASAYWPQRRFFISGIRTQIINAVVITVLCFLNWPGSWSESLHTSVGRGYGGYVTMLGVALFAISINFHFHDAAAVPKKAAAKVARRP
jgi:hypothetical protein